MKGLTTEQRINETTKKVTELMNVILGARAGGILEFDYVQELIQDIQKDQIDLISLIADMEFEKNTPKDIQIPQFMLHKKGA